MNARNHFRVQAEADFFRNHPELIQLLAISGEYIAGCMLLLSGKDFRNLNHGEYVSNLVVSFTRTHFIAIELLGRGELIESAVLARKQFELLARLHELIDGQLEKLIRKTPQLNKLTTDLRRLYSAYSEVAHSANPVHLQQLGEMEVDGHLRTPIYPVYSVHSTVTLQHLLLSLAEFHSWATQYLPTIFSSKERSEFEGNFVTFAAEYVKVYGDVNDEQE